MRYRNRTSHRRRPRSPRSSRCCRPSAPFWSSFRRAPGGVPKHEEWEEGRESARDHLDNCTRLRPKPDFVGQEAYEMERRRNRSQLGHRSRRARKVGLSFPIYTCCKCDRRTKQPYMSTRDYMKAEARPIRVHRMVACAWLRPTQFR